MLPRIGFVTCVELGRACIEEVLAIGGQFALFVTLEDHLARNKSGRVSLDDLAQRYDVPQVKIRHINHPETVQVLKTARLDWLFIIGWSQIASAEVLVTVKNSVLGMHPTLLPQGRGRAAVPWAILKGLKKTGVTLFALDEGVDSGPVADQVIVDIRERETAETLYRRVAKAHRHLMRKAWTDMMRGTLQLSPQREEDATYWPGRAPAEGRIEAHMSVEEVDRLIRATTRPYPGAFIMREGNVYTVWAGEPAEDGDVHKGFMISCRDGLYLVTEHELRRNRDFVRSPSVIRMQERVEPVATAPAHKYGALEDD